MKTDLISFVRYDTNIESIECLHFIKTLQFNTIRICDTRLVNQSTHDHVASSVERSGSGVEFRTLEYENTGSNPGCGVKTLGKFFHSTLLQFTQLNK